MKSIESELVKALTGKEHDVAILDDEESPCVVADWVSTGCLPLDVIMGGGLPVGRITEIYGDTSTGKSLIAAQAVAYAQQEGIVCSYIDTETAVSLPMMEEVGVDISKLLYSQPDTVEQVFEQIEDTIDILTKKFPDRRLFLVWDSIAATSVKLEMESEHGKAVYGRHAAVISQGLRKIARMISKANVCILLLNQVRQKIGVVFGDDETTFGGKAVPFYSSVRIRLKLGKKISIGSGRNKDIVGMMTMAQCVKNKVAIPFRSAELPIYFGHGVDDAYATLLYLKDVIGVVETSGGWHSIVLGEEERKFQRSSWFDLYDEHYDEIADMIFGDE